MTRIKCTIRLPDGSVSETYAEAVEMSDIGRAPKVEVWPRDVRLRLELPLTIEYILTHLDRAQCFEDLYLVECNTFS